MTEPPVPTKDLVVPLQLVLELEIGPVPRGYLRGANGQASFSGWMQLLAAIEDALVLASEDGPASLP